MCVSSTELGWRLEANSMAYEMTSLPGRSDIHGCILLIFLECAHEIMSPIYMDVGRRAPHRYRSTSTED